MNFDGGPTGGWLTLAVRWRCRRLKIEAPQKTNLYMYHTLLVKTIKKANSNKEQDQYLSDFSKYIHPKEQSFLLKDLV